MTSLSRLFRQAPVGLALSILLLAMGLSGCQPETAGDDSNDVSDPIDTDDSGSVELALTVRTLNYTQSNPGPTQVVLDVQVPTEAQIELYMNDVMQKSWNTGEACVEFPAFTVCEDDLEQSVAVIIESGGTKRFELTALKDGTWKTVTFKRNVSLGQCTSNDAFYENQVQDVLQGQCGSCHNGGNPAFSATDTWPQFKNTVFNSTHRLYQAPSHQEGGHNPQPLEPYDADYRSIAELVWRTLNNFECS